MILSHPICSPSPSPPDPLLKTPITFSSQFYPQTFLETPNLFLNFCPQTRSPQAVYANFTPQHFPLVSSPDIVFDRFYCLTFFPNRFWDPSALFAPHLFRETPQTFWLILSPLTFIARPTNFLTLILFLITPNMHWTLFMLITYDST